MSVITQNRGSEKPIPHPILDNPSKMMRIIANPVYDRLTLSRAANIRNYNPTNSIQQALQLSRSKERPVISPFKSSDTEETTITPLPNSSDVSSNQPQSKTSSKLQVPPALRLPSALSSNQRLPRSATPGARSRVSTARSRASTARQRPATAARSRATSAHLTVQSIQDELIADTANIQKPIADGTTRYVNSRHGFEVQHYSSHNWLSTDVYTKETCHDHEQTFREMLEKKRHYERLARSIYSSDYYSNRWNELLQSYKQGHLTHAEWAKQNYQLFFLKTLYAQAVKRERREQLEQADVDIETGIEPQIEHTFNESKDIKHDENLEHHHTRLHTPYSHNTLEEASFLSNNSFFFPMSNTNDENNRSSPNKPRLMSISINDDGEFPRTTLYQPVTPSKPISTPSPASIKSKALFMLDEQRWSLQAMVKRVVGLADALPIPPKFTDGRQSTVTNTNTDYDIE